jgi:hypothetical protein
MVECGCGCGGMTAGGDFQPGHDQKLRADLERRAGGLKNLNRLVETLQPMPFAWAFEQDNSAGREPATDQLSLLRAAKRIAKEYYSLTGRPLGITGEVAEYEAVSKLGLDLAGVRQEGYDATMPHPSGTPIRYQIKGRCMYGPLKPHAKMGAISLDKPWDAVLLVLLNADLDATAIYHADRVPVEEALLAPGSRARNERGQLAISKFKSIGFQVWP